MGSAFNWPEHYVIINGTKGSIKIDMQETAGSLRIGGQTKHFLVHETQEEDDDRRKGNMTSEMDGAIAYGHPENTIMACQFNKKGDVIPP